MIGGYTPAIFKAVPSQRKKGKKQVAIWLTLEEKALLRQIASASGKTTCADSMIKLFSTKYADFPTCFMTLDGGKFRKASRVFQHIIKLANLYNIDIVSHNIFPKVKNTIMRYYEKQIAMYNIPISLYIPITLGKSHAQSYLQYIEITKDYNWIGIFIWQHKFDCVYGGKEKCNGCAKSGLEREKTEGKKYKIHKWEKSMERGLVEVKKAKGGFYCIHNGGRSDSDMIIGYNDATIIPYSVLVPLPVPVPIVY